MSRSKFANMENIEFPSNDDLLTGPKENELFSYVSTTYLNGFINYVNIIGAYMRRHYKTLSEESIRTESLYWEESCALVDKLIKNPEFHTDVSESDKFDDIHILAKEGDFYYYFWVDRDSSDSCIGKISRNNFETDEEAMIEFRKYILDEDSYDDEDKEIKFIPKEFFTGWITL